MTAARCGVDDFPEVICRLTISSFEEVGVHAEGRCGVRVTEPAAHGLHVLAAREKDRRGEVTKVVKTNPAQVELIANATGGECHVTRAPRCPARWVVREHEIVRVNDPAKRGAAALAFGTVFSQTIDGAPVKAKPSRCVGLGVFLDELALAVLDDRSLDEQRALVQVEMLPSQRAELAASRA